MKHSEKIEVSPKETNVKKYTYKLMKMLKVILKLARIDGYDSTSRIQSRKGEFIKNSNLIQLLFNAMMLSRVLVGHEEFIYLLYKAQVEPELITNDNIRIKLQQLYLKPERKAQPKIQEDKVEDYREKRKRDNDTIDEYGPKRFKPKIFFPEPEMPAFKRQYNDDTQNKSDVNVNNKRKRYWDYPEND